MKYFFIPFLLFAQPVNAQVTNKLQTTNRADIDSIVNLVIAGTTGLKFSEIDTTSYTHGISYVYREGEGDFIIDFVKSKMKGSNDVTVYSFTGVQGNYENVFPFWQKYFNPDANAEQIKTAGHAASIKIPFDASKDFMVSFSKSGELWQIEIKGFGKM